MAIDMIQLVKDQLDVVLALDSEIAAAIPRQVDAQMALRGWTAATISDPQAVYVSIIATKALIPRLLLKFSQRVEEAKGGPAEAKFADAVNFLKALQNELEDQADAAARRASPQDINPNEIRKPSYPIPDVKGFS